MGTVLLVHFKQKVDQENRPHGLISLVSHKNSVYFERSLL